MYYFADVVLIWHDDIFAFNNKRIYSENDHQSRSVLKTFLSDGRLELIY